MLDSTLRPLLERPVERVAGWVDRPGVTPDRLTLAGLLTGLGCAGAAAGRLWWPALALWLVSRALDGLDGALARRRTAEGSDEARRAEAGVSGAGVSEAGGFLDITADFLVYGATVVGVAVGSVAAVGASGVSAWLPWLLVLLAYYVNGAAFLAFSSAAERTGQQLDDGRTFSFLGGLAEGTETIAVHGAWLVLGALAPVAVGPVAWGWAALVGLSAGHRMVVGHRTLRPPRASARPGP